jgi:hypothetical protein
MTSRTVTLQPAEKTLGRYTVDILRSADDDLWRPAMMQLDATVTTHRLLLRPFRRRYRPASLPATYFQRASIQQRGTYHCLSLCLKDDSPGTLQVLNLLVSTGRLSDFHRDVKAMLNPPGHRRYQLPPDVRPQHVRRLIARINQG